MLLLAVLVTYLVNSNSFYVNKTAKKNPVFFSRLFEREDFIKEDIKNNKENNLNFENEKKNDQMTQDDEIVENDQEEEIIVTRSGRSLDQDGKTNIWSVEPVMEIQENKANNLLKLSGIFFGVILVTFQFFLLTNPILPDPSDY